MKLQIKKTYYDNRNFKDEKQLIKSPEAIELCNFKENKQFEHRNFTTLKLQTLKIQREKQLNIEISME